MLTENYYEEYSSWLASCKVAWPRASNQLRSGLEEDLKVMDSEHGIVATWDSAESTGWVLESAVGDGTNMVAQGDPTHVYFEIQDKLRKVLPCQVHLVEARALLARYLLQYTKDNFSRVSNTDLQRNVSRCVQGHSHSFSLKPSHFEFCFELLVQASDHEDPVTAATSVTAEIKDSNYYTFFKLRSPRLVLKRRGKDYEFTKGDPLGWRFSSSGKFIRIISPMYGKNIVFSLALDNDAVLKWLDRQDPNIRRKGAKKSDKPEDANNKLEGYAVTDGSFYYILTPKPFRSKKLSQKVLYTKEQSALRDFKPFMKERKLKVKPVYTKDLGG